MANREGVEEDEFAGSEHQTEKDHGGMIDALLFAFRDAIRTLEGYDAAHCEVMADPDGRPPADCGDWFAAVHQGGDRQVSTGDHADDYYAVNVTLTMRVTVPVDRAGDQLLAKKLAAQPGPGGSPSFNARANRIRRLLDADWGTMQDANNNLLAMLPDSPLVYGFCEPARYRGGANEVQWCYDEWFSASEESAAGEVPVGIKATMRFEDCRRLEPMGSFA